MRLATSATSMVYDVGQGLQDSMAIQLPIDAISRDSSCQVDLCLEMWRESAFLGTYKLPLANIRQALADQVRRM